MSAIHTILNMTLAGLGDLAKADMVTGKPLQINDKTIIPIMKMSVSMGGGGGSGEGEGKEGKHRKHTQGGKGKGMGSGAGGGAHLTPVAIVVKDKQGVRILKVPHPKKGLEKLLDKIPALVEKIKKMEDG
jgi:uncharacterized spore protein YtfJ